MKRWRHILAGLGIVAMLFAGALFIEHKRAAANLDRYKRELIARGERLTVEELAPRYRGDKGNGARQLLAALERAPRIRNAGSNFPGVPALHSVAPGRARVHWREETLAAVGFNEKGWFTNLWDDLNPLLEPSRPLLDEVNAALTNEFLDFNLDCVGLSKSPAPPHHSILKSATPWLGNLTVYDLRHHGTGATFPLLLIPPRILAEWEEPVLLSHLIRGALATIFVGYHWEALQHPGWSEAQLEEWQSAWESVRIRRSLPAIARMERNQSSQTIASWRRSPSEWRHLWSLGLGSPYGPRDPFQIFRDEPVAALGAIGRAAVWPAFSSYADEAKQLEMGQAVVGVAEQVATNTSIAPVVASIAALKPATAVPNSLLLFSYNYSPDYWAITFNRAAETDARIGLLRTAIALRRFQLRHGDLPLSLAQLVPGFLAEAPLDPLDGQPLRYERQDATNYRLWSVGQDGVDQGGDPNRPGSGELGHWSQGADLVWPRPATPEEVTRYLDETRVRISRP